VEIAYRNVGYYLISLPLILIAGFWIPYLSEIPTFERSITAAVHIHALLLFAWVGLLVVQPLAIRSNSITLHRTLGKASFILLPLILIFGIAMLHKEYQEHLAEGMTTARAWEAEYLSSVQLALVAAFYCLAILRIRRRNVAEHMRYMICIALALLPAGLARTLGYWFEVSQSTSQLACLALIDFCLISLAIIDQRRRASSQPYAVALAAYLIVEAGWLSLGRPV
jgi:hypothetical protein